MNCLDREGELAAIDRLLGAARAGTGGVLVIEGPPGIGKTSLVGVARQRAAEGGMRVIVARGTELEREYPLGVVRQAFEPVLRDSTDRERLLRGAAQLSGHALLGLPEDEQAALAGLMHGLFWLVANLADERPVLLVVDDAQWADETSLRFLAYLARRSDTVAVATVIGSRSDPELPMALGELRRDLNAVVLAPATLSVDAVGRLLERTSGSVVSEGFASACWAATGGNPFLLIELARALHSEGVSPTPARRGWSR